MTRFAHIRSDFRVSPARANVATIAFRDGRIPGTVDYAVAFCSTRDQFCKAKGRAIAENRLNSIDRALSRNALAAKVGTVSVADTDYRTVVDTILASNILLDSGTKL